MQIGFQRDMAVQSPKISTTMSNNVNTPKMEAPKSIELENSVKNMDVQFKSSDEQKDSASKEKLQEAVDSINEFLHTQHKTSKFVFHEGLDKYYVKLVDAETEETIKEIPPEKLLNAFYEMQKLAGMIVDEKI